MIDLDILKCIFSTSVYNYIIKIRAGENCNLETLKKAMNNAYNYYNIANMYITEGCAITPDTYNKIIVHQNTIPFTIETCC